MKCSTVSQSSFHLQSRCCFGKIRCGITCSSSHALDTLLIWQLNSICGYHNRPWWEWGSSASRCSSYFPHPSLHLSAHHADKSHYESGKPSIHILRETDPDTRTGWVVAVGYFADSREFNTSPPWPVGLHRGLFYKEDHLDTCGWRVDGMTFDQCSMRVFKTMCVCSHVLYQQISSCWQQL